MAVKKWKVGCYWQEYGYRIVEAETADEALQVALEKDGALPEDHDYLDDSFNVDPESVEEVHES